MGCSRVDVRSSLCTSLFRLRSRREKAKRTKANDSSPSTSPLWSVRTAMYSLRPTLVDGQPCCLIASSNALCRDDAARSFPPDSLHLFSLLLQATAEPRSVPPWLAYSLSAPFPGSHSTACPFPRLPCPSLLQLAKQQPQPQQSPPRLSQPHRLPSLDRNRRT
jgi:hypothetical protein